ncbi:MAG: hypothetical protein AAFU61_18580, partial [Pseudomonadota bacterium]
VSAEALSLEADTRALSLSGPARLAGLPARIAWSERYGGEAGRTLSVRARVDDAALDRLGFGAVTIRDGAVDARLRIDGVQAPPPVLPLGNAPGAARSPWFCAGCPHNRSTKLPDGSTAGAGIGCHAMALYMDPNTQYFAQMGAEGMHWVGREHFSGRKHMFQNLGDG